MGFNKWKTKMLNAVKKESRAFGNLKPLVFFKPFADQTTVRKCVLCYNVQVGSGGIASYFGYSSSVLGGVDNSSKRPVCSVHAKKEN
jgi:hypothetical protein